MSSDNKLIFIYLGKKIPEYARASILLAQKFSGLEVVLLADSNPGLDVKVVQPNSFYDATDFEKLARSRSIPNNFRQGFWLKTLERIFVLEQYMKFTKSEKVLHAELDQILFRNDTLISKLVKLDKSGIFFPYHTSGEPIASVLFCNDLSSLSSLTDFAKTDSNYQSDMQLLGGWSKQNPKKCFILPTLATELLVSEFKLETDSLILGRSDLSGITDGAQLGQWVAGVDPRNVPISQIPQNHFVLANDPLLIGRSELEKTKFSFDLDCGFLKLELPNQEPINIYNLHLHAKIHKWLLKNPIERLIKIANSPTPLSIPWLRLRQISSYLLERFTLVRQKPNYVFIQLLSIAMSKLNIALKRRPSSKPYLSGDTFRKLAKHKFEKTNPFIDIDSISEGDIIFCESDIFDQLLKILKQTKLRVRVILGNSDQNFYSNSVENFESENISMVFAQNMFEQIPNFAPFPIGLENAWRFKHGIKLSFNLRRIFKPKKLFRVMWSFRFTNKSERMAASIQLSECESADFLGDLTMGKHQKALARYAFVASPPGNGLDTHRTWEAMYLNCVPIVKRSFMAEELERLGLPIWVVDSYEELKKYDEGALKAKYLEFEPKFKSDALWFDYWKDLIEKSK